MGAVKKTLLALAGATALTTTAAVAADFPQAPPPPIPQYVRAPDVGGWYLRGDVGIGNQQFGSFPHFQTNSAFVWPSDWQIAQHEIKSVPFIGFGFGYAWNNWLRFDVTGEYRANIPVHVLGSYGQNCAGGGVCFDDYSVNHSAWLGMVNAYLDLGTWWCVTPFIGAGVGGAYHTFRGFTDVGYNSDGTTGFGYTSSDHSEWTFAWALHAGLAYEVTPRFKVEFAYRYLNMGSPNTGVINCASTGCATAGPRASYALDGLYSHDLRLGLRWMLQPEAPVFQPPLMRRG